MKEYIEKKELKKLEQYQFGVSMCNIDEYVRISDIDKMPTLTEQEVTEVMQQLWKKKGAVEFAEKLKEKFRDFKEWETEDGYLMHTMSEIQRIYKCINFVDALLKEMGCCDE